MTEKANLFKEGQICEAYFSGDGQWYAAKVVGVSQDGLLYTVKYVEYDDTVNVRASSLREMAKEKSEEIERQSRKRLAQEALPEGADGDAKKKKFKDKKVHQEKKNAEMVQKAQSWKSFQTKVKPKESIFASPASLEGEPPISGFKVHHHHPRSHSHPLSLSLSLFFFSIAPGKVGVTGSGKGFTTFAQRKKHEFDQE